MAKPQLRRFPFSNLVLGIALTLAACGGGGEDPATDDEHDHEHGGHHGGEVVVLGEAHLEFVHDEENSAVRIFLTGEDAETPMAADGDLELRLMTAAGAKILTATTIEGEVGTYVASDPALASDPLVGLLKTRIAGDEYTTDLEEVHGHHDD